MQKFDGLQQLPVLVSVLQSSSGDALIPHIVWQNLHPLLERQTIEMLAQIEASDLKQSPGLTELMPKVIERILGRTDSDPTPVARLLKLVLMWSIGRFGCRSKVPVVAGGKNQIWRSGR